MKFDEIMKYHFNNRDVFDEIVENIDSISPFVGAGLSAFAYKSWQPFLKAMIDSKISDNKAKQDIIEQIEKNDFEKAASEIKTIMGIVNFEAYLINEFDPKKLNGENISKNLHKQSIFLLPMLFNGLTLTTNFEHVVEQVYMTNNMPFDNNIGHPGHTEMLKKALRENRQTLYKFHGDIVEIGNLILTKEKYDENYSDDSTLVKELSDCFKQKMFLFLGCSLNNDRTMILLNQIIENGITNYAILDCKEENLDRKSRELADRRIRTIFYPDGKYESVRIILEKILEIKNKSAYDRLIYHEDNNNSIKTNENPFIYDSGAVDFFGREEEIKKLNEFCDSDDIIKWWAVTGEGGSGKSRLLYEYKNNLPGKWDVVTPKTFDFIGLCNSSNALIKDTFFIIDYVQPYAKDIGKWIQSLTGPSSIKKRIILIERDGENYDNASWVTQIEAGTDYYNIIKNTCYCMNFLFLKELNEESLIGIMKDYAKKRSRVLVDKNAFALYLKLQEIDMGFTRPLYALLLVDAWLEYKEPLKWTRYEINNYIVNREIKRYKKSIESIIGRKNEKFCKAFLRIKIVATMIFGLRIYDEIELLCKDNWMVLREEGSNYSSFENIEDILQATGLIQKNNSNEYIVPPMIPDLIGEYFVLSRFRQEKVENIKKLVDSAWNKPLEAFIFFNRLLHDYDNIFMDEIELIKILIESTNLIDNVKFKQLMFATLLVNISSIYKEEIARLAVVKLEKLVHSYPENTDIVVQFAIGLYNLSNKQDENATMVTISKLEGLVYSHTEKVEIAVIFAKRLVNLSNEQSEKDAITTIAKLEELTHSHPDNTEVLVEFVKGLVNLSNKQDEKIAISKVSKLKELVHMYPENTEVVALFAIGLFNLLTRQKEKAANATIVKLEELVHLYPKNTEVVAFFAKGLFNLLAKQEEKAAIATIAKLEELVCLYPENAEVVVEFAKVLVNLSDKKDKKATIAIVAKLEEIHSNYDNPEVASLFAKGLFNLSNKQDEKATIDTIAKLEKMVDSHPDNAEIAAIFAKGMFNLLGKQDGETAIATVVKLEELMSSYPENTEIITIYGFGLVNLSSKQDEKATILTVVKLEEMILSYPENTEVAALLAKGLYNLSIKQDEKGNAETVVKLEKLAQLHPKNSEVVFRFAMGLHNLSTKQDGKACAETVERLEKLVQTNPENVELVELFKNHNNFEPIIYVKEI